MFEDLISLIAGFLTAYLIIRAVRSFRGGVGVVLVSLLGVESSRAGVTFLLHNSTGSSIAGTVFIYTDSGYNTYGAKVDAAAPAGGTGTAAGMGNGNWFWVGWGGSTLGGPPPTYYPYQQKYGQLSNVTNTIEVGSPPPSWVTNYFANGTNYWNGLGDSTYLLKLYTNGTLASTQDIPLIVGTNFLSLTNPIAGYTGPFTYSVTMPGTGTNDWISVTTTGSVGSVIGPSSLPSTNLTSSGFVSQVRNIGTDSTVTNQNSQIQSQQQNQSLLNQLQNLLDAQNKNARDLQSTLTNSVSGGGTNVSDQITHDKLQSATNLLTAVTNSIPTVTNLLQGILTNTARIETNTRPVSLSDVTNAIFGGQFSTNMAGATNQYVDDYQSGFGSLTNGGFAWTTNTSGATSNGMQVALGRGMVLDFNPLHNAEGLGLKLILAAPWVRKWLAWGVTFTLWWLCVEWIDKLIRELLGIAAVTSKGGGGDMLTYATRGAAALVIAMLIAGTLAALPTAAVAWMTTNGIGDPFTVDSILTDAVNAPGLGGIVAEYVDMLLVFVPLDVILVAFVSWVVFFFSAEFWFGLVCTGLRIIGLYVPCLLLLLGSVAVCGDQVRFENFTGGSIVASNGSRVLSFPPGVSDRLVLPQGNWLSGTNGWIVYSDGMDVIRAYGDTNQVGVVYFEQGRGYSAYQWWMWGMNGGFLIFGTTWAISAARSGILLRVRE